MQLVDLKPLYTMTFSQYFKLGEELIPGSVSHQSSLKLIFRNQNIPTTCSTRKHLRLFGGRAVIPYVISLEFGKHGCHVILVELYTVFNEGQLRDLDWVCLVNFGALFLPEIFQFVEMINDSYLYKEITHTRHQN